MKWTKEKPVLEMDDPEKQYQEKLESRLKALGAWYMFHEKPQSTVHTADAASVTGIELHRISKNLMAKTDEGDYVALIIPGDKKLDYKEAAKALGTKSLGLVPFEQADKVSGYPPGGTPSIGYERKLLVVLDEELAKFDTFFCGGGSTRMLLELKKVDVVKLNGAVVAKISK
ncbi:MAG: YbaK/EbsC family protein [Candidatus Micrarchaeota archaeon]